MGRDRCVEQHPAVWLSPVWLGEQDVRLSHVGRLQDIPSLICRFLGGVFTGIAGICDKTLHLTEN